MRQVNACVQKVQSIFLEILNFHTYKYQQCAKSTTFHGVIFPIFTALVACKFCPKHQLSKCKSFVPIKSTFVKFYFWQYFGSTFPCIYLQCTALDWITYISWLAGKLKMAPKIIILIQQYSIHIFLEQKNNLSGGKCQNSAGHLLHNTNPELHQFSQLNYLEIVQG